MLFKQLNSKLKIREKYKLVQCDYDNVFILLFFSPTVNGNNNYNKLSTNAW